MVKYNNLIGCKYETLVNILDSIRNEAPAEYAIYHPDSSDIEKMNSARSKAFIHLFLKVRFGISNFKERHKLITDGGGDGGVDAYYVDEEGKKVFVIQAKFRTKDSNFEARQISADDLVKMEISKVLKGEQTDSNNQPFNDEIKKFQQRLQQIRDPAHYTHPVVILGNLTRYNKEQITRLVGTPDFEVFNFERTYNELVFPICSGTYYYPGEIKIEINLSEKQQSVLRQNITTSYGKFNVRIFFVPTIEIAKIQSKYKNAILRFNPRNYLSLARNKVNRKIRDGITNRQANDFAIFNNGITLICDKCEITETTGSIDIGQAIITNPQIINGGQTAYTLSKIHDDDHQKSDSYFKDKEVLLKVVILGDTTKTSQKFIEEISDATNQQNRVDEADRRSNDEIQLKLQKEIFSYYGYLYERKRGEFFPGLNENYVNKSRIIDREDFLRANTAYTAKPSDARRGAGDSLFREQKFRSLFPKDFDFKEKFFAYLLFKHVKPLKNKDAPNVQGLRYAKMAIVGACRFEAVNLEDFSPERILEASWQKFNAVFKRWEQFESWAKMQPNNAKYIKDSQMDFDIYYKGSTIDQDIVAYFGPKEQKKQG